MSAVLERLLQQALIDPDARPGPENMAVDECLLEELGEVPVLRIYDWAGDWVSLGYFQGQKPFEREAMCPCLFREAKCNNTQYGTFPGRVNT